MKLSLELGAMCDDLSTQIARAGFAVPNGFEFFDRDAHEISRLSVRGLLTEVETNNARKRLVRDVRDAMRLMCQVPTK